jgi:putative intracellular protease/amidase
VPDLSDKRALYVLPRERYAVHCHESSAGVLTVCGVGITTAALEKRGVAAWGTEDPPLMPDMTIDEVDAADFDAVIFECGQLPESDNPAYQQLAREAVRLQKVLGVVCMMPVILAEAGLLEGKQATSNVKFLETLKEYGVDVDFYNDLVRDGNIITASFTSVEPFGWMVAKALSE